MRNAIPIDMETGTPCQDRATVIFLRIDDENGGNEMTNKEAIDILMEYNTWRRSEKVTALPMTGKTIGEAIDHAICSLNRLEVDTSEVVMSKKIELLNKITKEAAVLQQLVSKYNSMERGYGPLYAFENVIAEICKVSRNIRNGLEGE